MVKKCFIILFVTFLAFNSFNELKAQDDNVYQDMSLEELLDVNVVVTASKKPEDLFEAPLSVTIIKKDEIVKAGCTNIVDALRLSPGLIVRETTQGNYDVQIRGFDDVTKNLYVPLPYNTLLLVMIDNRIVYSYYSGGTLWETLPVSINDIERIEVVRGPAAALYGPNAANGVINIITSHAKESGLNTYASAAAGNLNTKTANINIGYNKDDVTKISFSGNYFQQNRYDEQYFDWKTRQYTDFDSLSFIWQIVKDSASKSYWNMADYRNAFGVTNNPDVSVKKMGGNVFFDHNFSLLTKLNIAAGAQNSQAQIPYFMNFSTPLSLLESNSYYVDSKFNYKDLFCHVNASSGEYIDNYPINSYKYNILDANIEYQFTFKNISLRPGIAHRQTSYDNPITYNNAANMAIAPIELKNTPQTLSSNAFSLLTEWKPTQKLRFIGGARGDKFNINSKLFFGYELAATYRVNKNNILRAVHSLAKRSPFIFDTYLNAKLDVVYPVTLPYNKSKVDIYDNQLFNSKSNNNYPTNSAFEISWRSKPASGLVFDIEIFTSKISDLLVSMLYRDIRPVMVLKTDYKTNPNYKNMTDKVDSMLVINAKGQLYFQNDTISARQNGMSFSVSYSPLYNLEFKVFGTLQQTNMDGNKAIKYITTQPDALIKLDTVTKIAVSQSYSHVNMTNWDERTTPTFFGGFEVNYQPFDKLNLNINTYYYSKQYHTGLSFDDAIADYTGQKGYYETEIKPYMVINAKVSYNIWNKATIWVSGHNLMGKHREFGYTDNIGSVYLLGLQWGF